MAAVFNISKIGQRFLWTTTGCPLLPMNSTVRNVPLLLHLAAARTLTALRPTKTHYEILDISPSATTKEIRQAFLKLSKQCHPDTDTNKNQNNHRRFVQVNEAYSVLSKPISRREYDASMTPSHVYGHYSESGHYGHGDYSHYKNYNNQTESMRKQRGQHNDNVFTNFYAITACLTCAAVALTIHYSQNLIPSSKLRGLRNNLKSHELEQHDLIMTSEHDGMIVYYYAVPKTSDPESYEVLAVKRNQVKDSDTHELQELNSVEYSRQSRLP